MTISLSAVTIRSPTEDSTPSVTRQVTPGTSSVPTDFVGGQQYQCYFPINPVSLGNTLLRQFGIAIRLATLWLEIR